MASFLRLLLWILPRELFQPHITYANLFFTCNAISYISCGICLEGQYWKGYFSQQSHNPITIWVWCFRRQIYNTQRKLNTYRISLKWMNLDLNQKSSFSIYQTLTMLTECWPLLRAPKMNHNIRAFKEFIFHQDRMAGQVSRTWK